MFPTLAPGKRRKDGARGLSFLRAGSISLLPWSAVQGHGGANQSFQSLLVHLVAFAEVDGAPQIALETGIEEACGVIQKGALGEGHLYDTLVGLAGADDPIVGPHRHPSGVRRFFPLALLDDFRVGLLDQSAEARKH